MTHSGGKRHTFGEQITEVEREIETRKKFYPKWVADGRITQDQATQRIALMQSVLETLRLVRCLNESG